MSQLTRPVAVCALVLACAVPTAPAPERESVATMSRALASSSPNASPHEGATSVASTVHPPLPSCTLPPGWRARDALFGGPTPTFFAAIVNPLLLGQHPFSVSVAGASGTWMMRASGTLTNTSLEEYFPVQYPVLPTDMSLTSVGFASSAPSDAGWIVFIDAASTRVWIPVTQVAVSATFQSGGCLDASGTLDAIALAAAGSLVAETMIGKVQLADLLGPQTSPSPAGWFVRLSFDSDAAFVLPD